MPEFGRILKHCRVVEIYFVLHIIHCMSTLHCQLGVYDFKKYLEKLKVEFQGFFFCSLAFMFNGGSSSAMTIHPIDTAVCM